MTNEGFLIIPRPFFQGHMWTEPRELSRAEAWIDLCRRAAYAPHNEYVGGKLFNLGYGQVVASQRFLMNAWKWKSLTKVQKYLGDLEKTGEIEVSKCHGQSLITCCEIACYYMRKVSGKSVGGQLEVSGKSVGGQIRRKKEDKEGKKVTTTTKAAVAADHILGWFKQLRTDQIFIEQCQRQHAIAPEKYQKLLNDFYKQKLALGELTHPKYTDLRKNFLFWIPKATHGFSRGDTPNNGQGIQYKNSINLKLPTPCPT